MSEAKKEEITQPTPIRSEQPCNLLNAAFIKAQGSFPVIEKKKSTSYKNVKFKWADLGAVRAVILPILAEHGLGVFQDVESVQGAIKVRTTLVHSSGQERKSNWLTLNCPTDPKQIGGNITYGCRYQLIAFLNIPVQEEDDIDENGDNHHQPQPQQKQQPRPEFTPRQYLDKAIEVSKGVWSMPEVEKYYFQLSGNSFPPSSKDEWGQLINLVRSGVEPSDVLK
jgi:hypothetical protein